MSELCETCGRSAHPGVFDPDKGLSFCFPCALSPRWLADVEFYVAMLTELQDLDGGLINYGRIFVTGSPEVRGRISQMLWSRGFTSIQMSYETGLIGRYGGILVAGYGTSESMTGKAKSRDIVVIPA